MTESDWVATSQLSVHNMTQWLQLMLPWDPVQTQEVSVLNCPLVWVILRLEAQSSRVGVCSRRSEQFVSSG